MNTTDEEIKALQEKLAALRKKKAEEEANITPSSHVTLSHQGRGTLTLGYVEKDVLCELKFGSKDDKDIDAEGVPKPDLQMSRTRLEELKKLCPALVLYIQNQTILVFGVA